MNFKNTNRNNNRNNFGGQLPRNYLDSGYFDSSGHLKKEFLTETASEIANNFGSRMNNSQLRRFYGHAKTAEKSFMYSHDEKQFINDIKQLDSFVAEAKGKDKVPAIFYNFVSKNIEKIESVKDIRKGFLPHFQAVVAYFTYYYPRS